jgi:hypothetical protein
VWVDPKSTPNGSFSGFPNNSQQEKKEPPLFTLVGPFKGVRSIDNVRSFGHSAALGKVL